MSASPPITAQPALSRNDWKRLNRLLAQALEVNADVRAGWITSLPDSDRDLLPILEQLLASDAVETAGAMPRLRSEALSQTASAAAARIEEQPGDQIGPYRLLRELGRGGMGTVWLAERTDGVIERQVAIKLPRAEWTDRGLADRMARERAVLASLNHPNIAQLLDAGWAGDGRPYLALEYVEGEPIDAWCRRRQLAPAVRIRLFVDVVRAVAFAHAKLVIHRDLKPSNVFVTAEGRVKLLDFGIAKLLNAGNALTEETVLTQFSGRALTLNYAAPEQLLGRPIATAADTYSLGVMLFELLSGERPYRPARESRAALEEAIVNTDPPAPSSVAADRAAARALRGDLDTIILKALRKQPEQRYETAATFADDLERWLSQRPVRAQRNSEWYLIRRFVARHRLGFAAGTVAMSALLIGGGVALWQSRAASEEAARADTVRDFVLSIIAQADPAASRETRDADLTLLTTAESRLAHELSARPALALELRIAIAKAYRNRGEFERTRSTLRQAIAEAEQALPADDPRLARAWIEIADWQLLGDKDVGPALDRAISTARQMGERGAELLVDGLHKRAQRRFTWEGRQDDSLTDVREAHRTAVKHLGPGHPTTLTATARLSEWLAEDDEMAERLALTEQAYTAALANAELGASDPRLLRIQGAHAISLVKSGRGREGLDLLRAAAKTARQYHRGGLPAESALRNLFEGLVDTGDAAGALEAAQQAYALAAARETTGGFNRAIRADIVVQAALVSRRVEAAPPMLTEVEFHSTKDNDSWADSKRVWLMNFTGDTVGAARFAPVAIESATRAKWPWHAISARLGWSYALRQDGLPDEADRVLQPLAQEKQPISPWEFDDILKERAAVKLALGDAAQALSLIDESIQRKAVSKLQTDPYLSDLYLTRGQALLQLGRASEALEAFRIAADFWGSYDADSHWAAEASYWLARALIETGDTATGKPMLKAAQARLAKSPMPAHRRLAVPTEALR